MPGIQVRSDPPAECPVPNSSLNEIDAIAGGLKFSFAGVTIAINEDGVTGIGIGGVIGVGVVDGKLCGYIGSHGGCIP